MKNLLILLILFASNVEAQTLLNFNKRYVESEDKWVAFPMKDSSYIFGFIYIDAQAGLTLNYEGTFKISPSGQFLSQKIDTVSIKARLEPNNVLVAFIPEDKFAELKIDTIPKWLKYYKKDTASIERLYHWGFMYNGWDQCAKALSYLEKAQKIDPKFQGLEVELAFSYNCLGDYDKAIIALQSALETSPTDAYTNKELVFALIKSGQLDKASESCRNALKVCSDNTYNCENCYNLLYAYYTKKDKANFNLWLKETKKWTSKNSNLTNSIRNMELEFSK